MLLMRRLIYTRKTMPGRCKSTKGTLHVANATADLYEKNHAVRTASPWTCEFTVDLENPFFETIKNS